MFGIVLEYIPVPIGFKRRESDLFLRSIGPPFCGYSACYFLA